MDSHCCHCRGSIHFSAASLSDTLDVHQPRKKMIYRKIHSNRKAPIPRSGLIKCDIMYLIDIKRPFRRYPVHATQTVYTIHMLDNHKRNTLKALTGAVLLPLLPQWASASSSTKNALHITTNLQASNPDLNITFIVGKKPMIKVQNVTGKLAILRHIQPGTINVGDKTYDLNSSLVNSAYAIGAGKSRLIPVHELDITECSLCLSERYLNKPLRMASIKADKIYGRSANGYMAAFI